MQVLLHRSRCCRILALALASLITLVSTAGAQTPTVAWNANPEPNLGGYILQYGTYPGNPATSIDVGMTTSRQVTGLQAGTTYYFRVLAYNTLGQQSAPSVQLSYVVPAAPTGFGVTSVSPSSGPTTGGTTISIFGGGFVNGPGLEVWLSVRKATNVLYVSSTELRVVTPIGGTGHQDVWVKNPNGQVVKLTRGYLFITPSSYAPVITSASPGYGATSGGTAIRIVGSGFSSGPGLQVFFSWRPALNIQYVSARELLVVTPVGGAGQQDIWVRNPDGQVARLAGGFRFVTPSSLTSTAPQQSMASSTATPSMEAATTPVEIKASTQAAPMDAGLGRAPAGDLDGDGLPGAWEQAYGLDAASSLGDHGAAGDPDRDGEPNSAEYRRGTHPRGVIRRYLAEGAVTEQLQTRLLLANPQAVDARVVLSFSDANGQTTRLPLLVPARSRRTVDLSQVRELVGRSFSTTLESDQVVGLDRLMTWDRRGGASSLETAVERPATRWYFAEGSTLEPFDLFYLVQNPSSTPAQVQVRYLLPNGRAPISKTYTVAAGSRATIRVEGEDRALIQTDVAAEITSLNETPIVVERTMFASAGGEGSPRTGDTSAGVTDLSTRWFFQASTGNHAMLLVLANPGATPAAVTATYTRSDGGQVTKTYEVGPNSRKTVQVATADPSLTRGTIAVQVESTNGTPIVVERSAWSANDEWDAFSVAGRTNTGPRWLLAGGEQAPTASEVATSIVVFNTAATATEVRVTLLLEDGPEQSATFTVGGLEQLEVPVAASFPRANGRRFSLLVEGVDPTARLVVDRAIF